MTCLADVWEGRARSFVALCDCRFALAGMPSNSVDLGLMDPPYGISFMGRRWDSFAPEATAARKEQKRRKKTRTDRTLEGNRRFQRWVRRWARELFRVMKPGAHIFVFGGTRTWHRLVAGLEDAGFEIRDSLSWMYGSGFPKSLDVSKAIDKAAGAERPVIGTQVLTGSAALSTAEKGGTFASNTESSGRSRTIDITGPATEAAKQWDGYGTALKPAFEPIVVARKPLIGTVAENILEHGTGALNIDACRVYTDWNEADRPDSWKASGKSAKPDAEKIAAPPGDGIDLHPGGRWPPNVLLCHAEGCERLGTKRARGANPPGRDHGSALGRMNDDAWQAKERQPHAFVDADGLETVADYRCVPGCPVRALDEQSGALKSGTASRFFPQFEVDPEVPFFYTAKSPKKERNAGLPQDQRNTHPTVKPIPVVRWQVRLACPPGGIILDPFAGSGTTGIATMLEGRARRFVGFDFKAEHVAIARYRIAFSTTRGARRFFVPRKKKRRGGRAPTGAGPAPALLPQLALFGRPG